MSIFNQVSNTDGVLIRSIIAAFLYHLREKIYFFQNTEKGKRKVLVPFVFSDTGQERFLLDTFLFKALEKGKAIGDYNLVPRAVLKFVSISILQNALMNKSIDLTLTREVGETMRTFRFNSNLIPLSINFDVTLVTSNLNEQLSILSSIISTMYKSSSFFIDLGGYHLSATYEISDDQDLNRTFEFGLLDKKENTNTFNIDLKFFLPVFERGLSLEDVESLIINPDNDGVGRLVDGEIRFGNIMEELDMSYLDISEYKGDSIYENGIFKRPISLHELEIYEKAGIKGNLSITQSA